MTKRVVASPSALALIEELEAENGELVFHQSGGCCDGSQPMCFPSNEFHIGYSDVCLGTIGGVPFWMAGDQFEYWKHTHLTIDVVEGRGSSFSLEIPKGKRFIVHSRLFSETELQGLPEVTYRED